MKHSTVLLILLVVVVMMARNPKKTTAQITTGEDALVHVGSAVTGGFLGGKGKG